METEWFDPKTVQDKYCEGHEAVYRPFTYDDIISAFVVSGIGGVIAIMFTAIERLYKYIINSN